MNLIYLWHFCYDFRTYFTYDFAVHHAGKIVRKYRFSVVYPVRSENILVCYVRFEICRQFAAIDQTLARLFYVLHQIPQRVLYFFWRAERLKIISPVPFKEIGVLVRRLHTVVFGVVILCFHNLSDHTALRNIEDTVEMQSAVLSAALPYPYMFPAFTGNKVFERVAERFPETLFRMLFVRKGESAKIAAEKSRNQVVLRLIT